MFEVPLRYDAAGEDGERIGIFVKRHRVSAEPRAQLWLLNGGPGGAGSDFEPLAEVLLAKLPDVELYLVDHRGTGRSERLSCAALADEPEPLRASLEAWRSCHDELAATWGEGLSAFSTDAAARDLAALVERTAASAQEVFIYGVSYGGFWAQRYLQLYPFGADAVVLDSTCAPEECELGTRYDALFDRTGRDLLDACAEEPECRSRLGGEPQQVAEDVFGQIDAGHCANAQLDRQGLRRLLATLLSYVGLRDAVPAVLHRLQRCNDADVLALAQLETFLAELFSGSDTLGSPVLGTHIRLSELMDAEQDEAISLSNLEGLRFSQDVGPPLAALHAFWPLHASPARTEALPSTNVPILILAGGLDPRTPPELTDPLAKLWVGAGQTRVVIPHASHPTLTQSPLNHALNPRTCGEELVAQFFTDPGATLDLSCLTSVAPPRFDGVSRAVNEAMFGSESIWDLPAESAIDVAGLSLDRRKRAPAPQQEGSAVFAAGPRAWHDVMRLRARVLGWAPGSSPP